MRSEGHNTLTIDGNNEDLDAHGVITQVGSNSSKLFAIADLSQAYKGKLSSWKRGVALLDDEKMLVQDEIVPVTATGIIWNFHTRAQVRLSPDGSLATLTQNGSVLYAHILSPAGVRFSAEDTKQSSVEAINRNVTNLTLHVQSGHEAMNIEVLFTKDATKSSIISPPLTDWTPR
ncbi:heparinase II/III domain-containing protein [Edaphobacter flagellatus]|uniref:heparinase II/III domain-containing protein n=1 Tax=Edaphobacter flagellatus TaxID=1933044 RepID=UPI0036F3CF44